MKIKFRVWDKVNNRMIVPRKFATVIPVLDFNGNLGVMDTYKNWHWHGIVPENEYELMLFTGILDKKGEEIYEDDLVQVLDYASWEGLYKVVWDEESLMYVLVDAYGDKEKMCEFEHYLIRGNIYENPELLEGMV